MPKLIPGPVFKNLFQSLIEHPDQFVIIFVIKTVEYVSDKKMKIQFKPEVTRFLAEVPSIEKRVGEGFCAVKSSDQSSDSGPLYLGSRIPYDKNILIRFLETEGMFESMDRHRG
jgi:hypothetical protein